MSSAEFTTTQIDFLSGFFGPGNRLRWDAFASGNMPEASRDLLTPLIEDLRRDSTAIILPRVTESEPPGIMWYAMARDARQSRALREQLLAFIGPTYTDFVGQHAILDANDSIETAVRVHFAPHAFRLAVINPSDREVVRNQIFLMRSLWERRVDRATSLVRPVGRLLRDLEMALVVGNEESAWRCLDDIRSRGRLSAQNLAFLKVRILASFQQWEEIAGLPEFQSLVSVRRPLRITQALVHAVYEVHFASFERQNDVNTCVERFRELEPTFGTLFRARGPLNDPVVLKAFLLRAVSAVSPSGEVIAQIHTALPASHPDRAWVEALVAFAESVSPPLAPPVTPDLIAEVRAACDAGNFDRAFDLLLECDPSTEVIRQLLACSAEIDSLEAITRATAYVENCSTDLRETALSMRIYRQIWDGFQTAIAPAEMADVIENVPSGWLDWLERLCRSDEFSGALEIIRRGAVEWSIDELLNAPDRVARVADLMGSSRSPSANAVLRNAVPTLVEAFFPDGQAHRQFKPIYLNLALVLALDDSLGANDLTALASLAEASLEAGLEVSQNQNEVSDLVETIETAWKQVASIRHLDWALGVLDLLIAFNAGQHAPVDRFFHQIAGGMRQWSCRVRADQWDYAEQLADDLTQSAAISELRPKDETTATVPPSLADQLAGKTIAIYTLTERIGHRASQLLTKRFSDVDIQLIHDKVASDRLKQLAHNADIFVVNTWDAKHAATNAIKDDRPDSKVTLLPQSKSAGSIVRVVYESTGSPQ